MTKDPRLSRADGVAEEVGGEQDLVELADALPRVVLEDDGLEPLLGREDLLCPGRKPPFWCLSALRAHTKAPYKMDF